MALTSAQNESVCPLHRIINRADYRDRIVRIRKKRVVGHGCPTHAIDRPRQDSNLQSPEYFESGVTEIWRPNHWATRPCSLMKIEAMLSYLSVHLMDMLGSIRNHPGDLIVSCPL